MFEGLQKHSQSLFLVILVISVATIFGVSWGPGARGCEEGNIAVTYVAKVHGRTLIDADFIAIQRFLPRLVPQQLEENPAVTAAMRQAAIDGLIERELLAHEAQRVGFRVTEAQANEEMQACRLYVSVGLNQESTLGVRSGPVQFPASWCGEGGFDYATFERMIRRSTGRTVTDYRESMMREMLAQRMRETVLSSVQVSDEEMWLDYQRTHDQTAVRYLRFALSFYRDLVRDDDAAAVQAWAGTHGEDINRQYERRRDSLRGLPREVRVRHLLLRFTDEHPTDAQKAETRARAESLRARLAAGEDFVRLARLYSDDNESWRNGGELGWRRPDGEHAFPPAFAQAVAALQPNGLSPVTETAEGMEIIQLLGTREGDVPEVNAKRDIARTLFREAHAAELAQQAARTALQRVTTGTALDVVSREVNQAAVQEFYRGPVPPPVNLPGGLTLAPVERAGLDAPELKDSEQFPRNGSPVPGLEHPEALAAAAFALTPAHPLSTEPLRVDDDWFLLRYKDGSRTNATREEFQRQRQELLNTTYGSMLAARQRTALVEYVARLRRQAEHDGNVRIGNSPRLRPPSKNQDEEPET